MLRPLLAAAALALAAAAAAQAQPETAERTTVCVDVNGGLLAPDCRAQASRLQTRQDICLCPRGQRIEASICPPGLAAPPESLALALARRQIVREQGTLVGASVEGRPLCVPPRQH